MKTNTLNQGRRDVLIAGAAATAAAHLPLAAMAVAPMHNPQGATHMNTITTNDGTQMYLSRGRGGRRVRVP